MSLPSFRFTASDGDGEIMTQDQHGAGARLLSTNDAGPDGEFRQYGRRWFILLIISLLQISNAILWITYAPIIATARQHYETTETGIDMLSMVFMIAFIPLGFPASWALNTWGLRKSVCVFAFVNCIGGWVRFLSEFAGDAHTRYDVVFIGQALAAIAQPVILDCPTLMAATWFSESQRAEANTIASVSNPLGMGIGSVVAALLVTKPADMFTMHWVLAIPPTVALLLVLVFLADKPPTPPSASAGIPPYSFSKGIKTVLRNKMFLLLCFSFGIGTGLVSTFTTVTAQITAGQGYTDDQASYFNLMVVGVGLVGAGCAGVYVDKTKDFNRAIKVAFLCAATGFLMFSLVNRPSKFALISVSCCIIGFFGFASLPVALELSVETTFPVSEGVSAGLMWMCGQIFGVIFLSLVPPLKGGSRFYNGTTRVYNVSTNGTLPPGIIEYYDYTNADYMLLGAVAVAALSMLLFNTE